MNKSSQSNERVVFIERFSAAKKAIFAAMIVLYSILALSAIALIISSNIGSMIIKIEDIYIICSIAVLAVFFSVVFVVFRSHQVVTAITDDELIVTKNGEVQAFKLCEIRGYEVTSQKGALALLRLIFAGAEIEIRTKKLYHLRAVLDKAVDIWGNTPVEMNEKAGYVASDGQRVLFVERFDGRKKLAFILMIFFQAYLAMGATLLFVFLIILPESSPLHTEIDYGGYASIITLICITIFTTLMYIRFRHETCMTITEEQLSITRGKTKTMLSHYVRAIKGFEIVARNKNKAVIKLVLREGDVTIRTKKLDQFERVLNRLIKKSTE